MFFAILQFTASIILLVLAVAEFAAWTIKGGITGLGYLAMAVLIGLLLSLAKESYKELQEERKK